MSLFGEISEPSTRTAWEDWDDDLIKETIPMPRFQNEIDPPVEINTLVILEGRYLYNFVRDSNELQHVNYAPEINLHLYKSKELNNYICIIKDYNLLQSGDIVELLKDYITSSTDVIGILTKPLVEYLVEELITTEYVIRSLCTTKQLPRKAISNIANLEQPNMISGLIAGALCLREIIDKPAVALVCYISTEEEDIQELQDILRQNKLISHQDKLKRNHTLNSNLYI